MNIKSSMKPFAASQTQANSTTKPPAKETSTESMEDRWAEEDKKWQEFNQERQEYEKGSLFRGLTVGTVAVAALGAGGYALGSLTGIGGAIAGGAIGLAAGVTAGGIAGSIAGSGKGSSGLGYLGIGVVAGAAVGGIGGAFAGASAMPVAGAIAGAVGGVAVGFMGNQMMEDRAFDSMREKHGLDY